MVTQTVRELGWAYRWPGAANRESQTLPVRTPRQQLQARKLLRESKGRLVLSPSGRKMRDGGRPLWDHLAEAVAFPADQATAAVTRIVEGGKPVPLDVAQDLRSDARWMLDCLQLKVPVRTFGETANLTDGGRKVLLRVQGLLDGV